MFFIDIHKCDETKFGRQDNIWCRRSVKESDNVYYVHLVFKNIFQQSEVRIGCFIVIAITVFLEARYK